MLNWLPKLNYKIRVVKTYGLLAALVLAFFISPQIRPAQAQSIKILAGNTLNGTMTGTILGGATMGLRNSNDFAPLRVGVGAGTLYGIAVGVYDISQVSKGEPYYISGTFNDGDNTTIIVLLDTFYGAAAGAIVATSFNLIANEPITEGLQYGASIGAFAGFGFGLVDAFLFAQKPGDFGPAEPIESTEDESGLISISDDQGEKGYQINLLKPAIYSLTDISRTSISLKQAPGMDLVHFKIGL